MNDPKLLSILICLVAACAEPVDDAADPLDGGISERHHDCDPGEPMTIELEPYGAMCPYHKDEIPPPPPFRSIMTGDRDFGGNGPAITIDVDLEADGNRVLADIRFRAQETGGGDTSLDFVPSFKRVIGRVPEGLEVAGFVGGTRSTIQLTSPKADWEFGACNDGDVLEAGPAEIAGDFIASALLIGDTGHDDISDDFDCGCDMRLEDIVFNEIEVLVREAGSCEHDPPPTGSPPSGNPCGDECESDDDCASNACQDGVCVTDCVPDEACTVSGENGICAQGITECGECGSMCVPTTGPQEEVCDGQDNDCNGVVDDIDPQACQGLPVECGGLEFTGETACSGGEQYCKLVPGADYCSGCDNAGCGTCGATGCIPSADACIPNHWCGGEGGFETCRPDPFCEHALPQCYLPSDVGVPPDHCYSPS